MIISRLQGGLGNQLFQYAAGRVLADRSEQRLGLDLRDLQDEAAVSQDRRGNTVRPYLLDRFNVRARVLSRFALLLRGHLQGSFWRAAVRTVGLDQGRYVQERSTDYRPLPRHPAGVYLDGYWQSFRYFEGQRAMLLKDLSWRKDPQGKNAAFLKRMARQKTVCVHVRRGDYVSLPAAKEFHGLMGVEYYRAAVKRLGAAARNAVYYVFSDEPAWARKHLELPGKKVVVDHNSVRDPEEDLRLMAACRHFIIANSSLSWWAAWMGTQKQKKVIAPAQWFRSGPETPDLCPKAWVRL